jgi:hypothetical protein
MFIGWTLASLSIFALLSFSDLHIISQTDETTGKTIVLANEKSPSIGFLSFTILFSGIGYWLADVMADSVVVRMESTNGYNISKRCFHL